MTERPQVATRKKRADCFSSPPSPSATYAVRLTEATMKVAFVVPVMTHFGHVTGVVVAHGLVKAGVAMREALCFRGACSQAQRGNDYQCNDIFRYHFESPRFG